MAPQFQGPAFANQQQQQHQQQQPGIPLPPQHTGGPGAQAMQQSYPGNK